MEERRTRLSGLTEQRRGSRFVVIVPALATSQDASGHSILENAQAGEGNTHEVTRGTPGVHELYNAMQDKHQLLTGRLRTSESFSRHFGGGSAWA